MMMLPWQRTFVSGAQTPWRLERVHAVAALAAVCAAALFVGGLDWHMRHLIHAYATALAPLNLPEAARGVALQHQILRHPELLPIYGSSELAQAVPTRPAIFFRTHRTGFGVFPVGGAGDRCLIILQEVAAMGRQLRGKRIVIFLSPSWFNPPPEGKEHAAHRQFAARYSPLEAGVIAGGHTLSAPLRRDIARRLLDYNSVLQERSPVLAATFAQLQDQSWGSVGALALLQPLCQSENFAWRLQDRWAACQVIRDHPGLKPTLSADRPRWKPITWSKLVQNADKVAPEPHRGSFEGGPDFGTFSEAEDAFTGGRRSGRPRDNDADFLHRMAIAKEWTDFTLLLRVLRELGVHALLIDQPINGSVSDNAGVSASARLTYYQRIRQIADSFSVPVEDFSSHEDDPSFFSDVVHPSAKAWIYYNQSLDEFYHRRRRSSS